MNQMDMNWSKTYFKIIIDKRIIKRASIICNYKSIAIVDQFKLLGMSINNKLI
jgi:hypothetical protein